MEAATEQDLELRRVVKISAAAKTLGVTPRKVLALMDETNTPVVELGPKWRGLFLKHLDDLLLSRARPVKDAP
jgi:hypothetical protein